MGFTIPNAPSAAFTDQAEPDARDFEQLASAPGLNGVMSGCAVTAQGSPDMTVAVAAGEVIVAGTRATVAAGNVTITAADGTNPRFDLVCVDATGAKSAVAGTAAANPVFPDPAGKVVLATVYVPASDTTIATNQIVDKRVSIIPWMALTNRLYDATQHGVSICTVGRDGATTAADATFTSASANFTAADIGKQIIIWNAGDSGNQSHSSTILSINSATSVELNNNAGRTDTNLYYAFGADTTTALQALIDKIRDNGGGTWITPGWVVTSGLVGRNRVVGMGIGQKNSGLILTSAANKPVYRSDSGSPNAQWDGLRNMGINGSRKRQSVVTTTTTTTYTAGSSTTLTLTDASAFLDAGTFAIGTQRFRYSGKSGNQLTGVLGGREGTTDTTVASGATITQQKAHGIHHVSIPSFTQDANDEDFDAHWGFQDLYIHDVAGWGLLTMGRSTSRARNIFTYFCELGGFYGGADTFYSDCESGQCGGFGFLVTGTSENLSNCKAWYSGNFSTAPGGNGFLFEPTSTQPVEGTTHVDIIAQDCKKEGVWARFADRINGRISASSNGTLTADTYAGVKLTSANHCLLDIVSTERVSALETQFNALEIDAGSNYNQIDISHGAASDSGGTAVVGPAIRAGSDLSGGNRIQINSMGGRKSQSVGTATYTADPYLATTHQLTLTGTPTIAAPSNAHLNCTLTFEFVQDATGGRIPSFNATYQLGSWTINPAPNGRSSITFTYNGTNWIATAYTNSVTSRGGSVLNPTGAVNVHVWRAPFACTVVAVKGIRRGGSGATINARKNGASNHLASNLSLTSADTWTDGGAVQNTALAAGDSLEIMIVTVTGLPTEVGVQVDIAQT